MMRVLAVLIGWTFLGAVTSAASAQTVDISDLLGMLGGSGLAGDLGDLGTTGPSIDGQTPDGGAGEAQPETLIPQENLRAARNRRPGLWVTAGIAHYHERTSNLGHVGPSQAPVPDVPEEQRVLPIIVNDVLGSFFDMVNQVVSGLAVWTTLQSGLAGGTGGLDFDTLLRQLTGSQGGASKDIVSEPAGPLPEPPEVQPEADQAVVIPFAPGQ